MPLYSLKAAELDASPSPAKDKRVSSVTEQTKTRTTKLALPAYHS